MGLSIRLLNINNMRKKANIKDAYGNDVYFGDIFDAYIMTPSLVPPTKVKVVKDESVENLAIDRDFDVEDEKGDRIWNAYMVIKGNDYKWDGGKEAFKRELNNKKQKYDKNKCAGIKE